MSHESDHAAKPFAGPSGVWIGLFSVWAVWGLIIWLICFKLLQLGGAPAE